MSSTATTDPRPDRATNSPYAQQPVGRLPAGGLLRFTHRPARRQPSRSSSVFTATARERPHIGIEQ
ncbi:hypothetical protein [Streptomyces sp. NPDC088400]|uniref:hypothetical protein n=1 Tax=Streptomyces sp. NPDC088400 TaxID=3365861 RepID=UPI003818DDC4